MNKNLMQAAIAAALTGGMMSAMASNVISFDPDGSGPKAAVKLDQFSWAAGNVLFDDTFPGATNAGTFYGQTTLGGASLLGNTVNITGNQFTYQFSMPVSVTTVGAVATVNQTAKGTFQIFANTNNADPLFSTDNGTGFGNMNGAAMSGTQSLVLSGTFDLQGKNNTAQKFTLTDSTVVAGDASGSAGELGTHNANGKSTLTDDIFGSVTLNIAVNFQDFAYFKTPFSNVALDMTVSSMGLTVPFDSQVDVSKKVVNVSPFFGDPTATDPVDNVAKPVNDFQCPKTPTGGFGGATTYDNCDLQVQNSGNSFFTVNVPEPTNIALMGAGLLVLAGQANRRRAKRA